MNNKLLPLAIVAALLLAGCKETASDTASDVADARQEASQDNAEAKQDANETIADANAEVADAQEDYVENSDTTMKKLTIAESEAMVKAANADYDVAKVEAEGRHKIAREKCDALSGAEKDSCNNIADANLTADTSSAAAVRDALLVDATHHE
jgi:hypothetical protein